MNCNEARRLITAYVKKELPDRELEQFLYHVEHCSDCMDELDTYYTVYQALDLLDFGGCHDYDFRNMLKNDIRKTKRGIVRRRMAGILLGVVMLLTEFLLAVSIYTGYEVERGAQQSTLIERAILHMNYRGQKIPESEDETREIRKNEQQGTRSKTEKEETIEDSEEDKKSEEDAEKRAAAKRAKTERGTEPVKESGKGVNGK